VDDGLKSASGFGLAKHFSPHGISVQGALGVNKAFPECCPDGLDGSPLRRRGLPGNGIRINDGRPQRAQHR
jgi:hypothetical protein